jgi:hypothetical protein
LIEAVRAVRPLVAAVLEQADSVHWSDERLTVAFSSANAALRKQLEQQGSLSLLRTSAEELSGRKLEIRVESIEPDAEVRTARPEAAGTGHGDRRPTSKTKPDPSAPRKRPARQRSAQRLLIEEARRSPGVAKLLDSFGAQVVEITPLDIPADTLGDPEN